MNTSAVHFPRTGYAPDMELFILIALVALPLVGILLLRRTPSESGPTAEAQPPKPPPEYPQGWYVDQLNSRRGPKQ